ncbi:MAG: sugar phosphate isomerase/epimerase [Candidatus Woesearchaeota archaeon]|nr:MAG: sugar phosphate isomerase/epimerase [Candidatus Woesearchaeota archaeon]
MVDYFYKKYDGTMDPYGSWQLEAYRMGPSTNPKADQLKEFNLDANWGAKNIEIGFLSNRELEAFPKPAAEEVRRLSKLTGAQPSVHGPVEDPAGFDEMKKEQKEYARKGVVNKFFTAMKTAHDTGGAGTPVVFHASNYLPGDVYTKDSKTNEEVKEASGIMDRETGKFMYIAEREKKLDRSGEEIDFTPEMQLEMINRTFWSDNIRKLANNRKQIEEINKIASMTGKPLQEAEKSKWSAAAIKTLISNTDANILNIYHDFAKYMPKPEEVKDPDEKYLVEYIYKERDRLVKEHNKIQDEKRKAFHEMVEAARENDQTKGALASMKMTELSLQDIDNWQTLFSEAGRRGLTPRRYTTVEDYTLPHAAKTFAETAFKAYKKYGDNAPYVMIENAPAPGAFSRPDQHKKLVEKARDTLVKDYGVSREKANKLIQATLDVGHFGLWRQYGYKNEDIVEMAKKIAPIAGHLHITDNFGSADAHLPPGWGDLPSGEIIEMLKRGGFKGRTIVEAGGAEALGYAPYLPTLEYFNSGIYSWTAKPSWTEVGEYFFGSSGYAAPGIPMPYHHQQMYGTSGFGNLPPAAGVDKKEKSGLSGTPYS